MALDTRNKRSSAIQITIPWRGMYPNADGTVAQADRQAAALMYAGISASSVVAPTKANYVGFLCNVSRLMNR